MSIAKDALKYHRDPKPGKIEVIPSKPCLSQTDLSLAYTPGVGVPCLRIQKDANLSYEYTTRGNLVGVITNGTAVLGLGNIGPLAAKPVMEGKGVLFKRFADLDVFDIEVDTTDPDEFIRIVRHLEPTFGGINLEDIKAPECFYIEEKLSEAMNIPVFHDDQHGTAIISAAALINACELTKRHPEDLRVVINGAGAAGIACARMYMLMGVKRENILLLDSRGVIHKARENGMNPYKDAFAADTARRTLADAVDGADALVGLSVKGAFSPEHLKALGRDPIIFALANPDPEIGYHEAKTIRPDAIVATGRSDYPNQVNNVLGFPFIFRGALDVRASKINRAMKVAAVRSLAELTRQDVPDSVIRAYGGQPIRFGADYIIPKPLDSRVLLEVAPAVAAAAVESGVADKPLAGHAAYVQILEAKLSPEKEIMRKIIIRAQQDPKRIVLPEGNDPVILRAAHQAALRVREAVELIHHHRPDLVVDGEMQVDTAVRGEFLAAQYPFNRLGGPANVLIFPDLASGNVAYKLLEQLGGLKAVGPLLMGIGKPFNVLQRGTDMENVVNVIAITVAQAQESKVQRSDGTV